MTAQPTSTEYFLLPIINLGPFLGSGLPLVSCVLGSHCFSMIALYIHLPEAVHADHTVQECVFGIKSLFIHTNVHIKQQKHVKAQKYTKTHIHTPVILSHSTLPFKGRRSTTVPGAQTQHLSSVYCLPRDVIDLELTSGSLHRSSSSAVCHVVSLCVFRE